MRLSLSSKPKYKIISGSSLVHRMRQGGQLTYVLKYSPIRAALNSNLIHSILNHVLSQEEHISVVGTVNASHNIQNKQQVC